MLGKVIRAQYPSASERLWLCFHKFKHNFGDSINRMCPINDGIETTEHLLLLCQTFEAERRNLLARVFELLQPYAYANFSNGVLTQLLLYGDKGLPNSLNWNILGLTLTVYSRNWSFQLSITLYNH